ncbi:phage holin family protein [Actinomadura fulvescens]|uniref:Phage holin family protein n=1 Tax=Actinomadura fulvescens TaxID=46160 RepID=A0ABN3P9Y8_9ACTN
MKFLIRVLINAVALWVATVLVDGISVSGDTTAKRWLTLLAVAVIFGVVNAFIKPVIKVLGCAFYVLTLGLFALVVNAALLMLTSWAAGKLSLPFHVEWFWPAFWGAIIVSVVSWLLSLLIPDGAADDD